MPSGKGERGASVTRAHSALPGKVSRKGFVQRYLPCKGRAGGARSRLGGSPRLLCGLAGPVDQCRVACFRAGKRWKAGPGWRMSCEASLQVLGWRHGRSALAMGRRRSGPWSRAPLQPFFTALRPSFGKAVFQSRKSPLLGAHCQRDSGSHGTPGVHFDLQGSPM